MRLVELDLTLEVSRTVRVPLDVREDEDVYDAFDNYIRETGWLTEDILDEDVTSYDVVYIDIQEPVDGDDGKPSDWDYDVAKDEGRIVDGRVLPYYPDEERF